MNTLFPGQFEKEGDMESGVQLLGEKCFSCSASCSIVYDNMSLGSSMPGHGKSGF